MLVFAWISSQLFFEEESKLLFTSVKEIVFPVDDLYSNQLEVLNVVFPAEPLFLDPNLADPITRQRTDNIFETLVRFDRDLNVEPVLALSWGMLDDYTWEFNLRPNVKFHDGSNFDMDDVLSSFNRAMNSDESELIGVLSTIELIYPENDNTFILKTINPDPLLLQRLTTLRIFPSEYEDYDEIPSIGTAPYEFVSWEKEDVMTLKRFENYWGPVSQFKEVNIFTSVDKNERVRMLVEGEVDLLVFVPFDAVSFLEEYNYDMRFIPSLEVQFLMFNFLSDYFSDIDNRKAFSLALNQQNLINAVGGYAKKVNQFVSNGVFGFNLEIPSHEYDIDKAKALVNSTGLQGKTIQFHLPIGLTVLGDFVRESLSEIGVNVVVSNLSMEDLVKSMESGDADLYFFGFKSELADSADFLNLISKTDSPYNYGNYSNKVLDKIINSLLVEINENKRLTELQDAMSILIEEDIVGVPLFEYETIFSFSDKLDLKPRIDGQIYFDDLIKK